jgi:hypothetical protein
MAPAHQLGDAAGLLTGLTEIAHLGGYLGLACDLTNRQSRLSSDIRTRHASANCILSSAKAFQVLLVPGQIAQTALDAVAQVRCQV